MLLMLAFLGAESIPIHTGLLLSVLEFACGLSLLTGDLFGVTPAWQPRRLRLTQCGTARERRRWELLFCNVDGWWFRLDFRWCSWAAGSTPVIHPPLPRSPW